MNPGFVVIRLIMQIFDVEMRRYLEDKLGYKGAEKAKLQYVDGAQRPCRCLWRRRSLGGPGEAPNGGMVCFAKSPVWGVDETWPVDSGVECQWAIAVGVACIAGATFQGLGGHTRCRGNRWGMCWSPSGGVGVEMIGASVMENV